MNPILLLVAGGVFIAMVCVLFAFGDDDGADLKRRASRLHDRTQRVVSGIDLQLRRELGDKSALDRLVRRLTPQPELLRDRLRRTGYDIGLGTYGIVSLVVALAVGGAAVVLSVPPLVALPAGLLCGLWLPHIVVGFLGKRRAGKFTALLPEAIGLMVRGIKSGLPITESFQIVGREVADPVGSEFRQICDQIRIGRPVEQAMWDSAKRIGVPEMKFLCVTLGVQRETGGNLSETLENLDNILRRRRQMRLKIKSLSSEARASAAILGALPFIMMGVLSVADSSYIAVLFNEHLGNILLAAGATSMTVGIGVMAKMVRFDI